MRHTLSLVSLLALSAPAYAQTVDLQGAGQLIDNLSRYVGKTVFDRGILKVAPDGDAYELAFDTGALLALLPAETRTGLTLEVAPYALRLKPGVGDKWDVSGPVMPNVSMAFDGPEGKQTMGWTVAESSFTSVYDPAIASFTTMNGTHGRMTMQSSDPFTRTDVSIESGSMRMESVKAAGGVDVSLKQTMNGFSEDISANVPETGTSFSATVKAPTVTITSKALGYRSSELLDLLAFGVANADETRIKANQSELKSRVLALLPIWNKIDGTYEFNDMTVVTMIGEFGARTVGVDFDSDGISTNGSVNYGIRIAGLTVPTAIVPPWALPLLPTDMELVMGGARLDSDTAVRTAVAAFDLNQTPPIADAVGEKIAADFLARNPTFTIGRSFLKTADSEIAFNGEFTYVDQKPAFQATIDAKGYDKIVASMQAAASASPEASQVFPFVLAAQGMARTMPDGSLQWLMDVRPDGSIRVNGNLVKPADAPAEVTP